VGILRALYPADWEEISGQVKCAAHYRCEGCGKQCRKPGEPFDSHERTLTCAHLERKPWVADKSKLGALCVTCHFRYDASFNQKKRWFHAKIDGGVGHVGVQLHMFVQGLAVGRAIKSRDRLLTSVKESGDDQIGARIGGGSIHKADEGRCGGALERHVGGNERGAGAGGKGPDPSLRDSFDCGEIREAG